MPKAHPPAANRGSWLRVACASQEPAQELATRQLQHQHLVEGVDLPLANVPRHDAPHGRDVCGSCRLSIGRPSESLATGLSWIFELLTVRLPCR
jgi:hypothetical protein